MTSLSDSLRPCGPVADKNAADRALEVLQPEAAAGGWGERLKTVWPALAPAVEAVSEAVAPLAATLALAIGTIFLLRGPRRAPAPAES